jgi:hypothetical protein
VNCSAASFRPAGLVDAYAAACRTVASTLQGSTPAAQQQQQQQGRQFGAAQVNAAQHTEVAFWLLATWETFVNCWPERDGAASALSASGRIAAAAPAFVSLALAVLRHPTIADSLKKGFAVDKASFLCSCLELEVMQAIAARGPASQHQTLFNSTEAGSQMMQSQELPMLLAVCSAACAQDAYTRANGKAGGFPATKKGAAAAAAGAESAVAVLEFHSNLLKYLQVTGGIKLPAKLEDSEVLEFMNCSCTSLQNLMVFTLNSTCQVGSSSSAAAVTAAAALPLSLVESWVLTLVQQVLLLRPKYKAAPLSAAGAILQAARAVAAAGGYGLAGKAALDSCKGRLSKPLLQQLLPDIWQALKSSKAWKRAERSTSSSSSTLGGSGTVDSEDWPLAVEMGLRVLLVELVGIGECHMRN